MQVQLPKKNSLSSWFDCRGRRALGSGRGPRPCSGLLTVMPPTASVVGLCSLDGVFIYSPCACACGTTRADPVTVVAVPSAEPPTVQVLTGPILVESSRAVTVQSRSVVQVRFESREGATVEAQRTSRVPRSPAPDTVVALAATPAAEGETRRAMAGTLGQPPADVGAPWRHPARPLP